MIQIKASLGCLRGVGEPQVKLVTILRRVEKKGKSKRVKNRSMSSEHNRSRNVSLSASKSTYLQPIATAFHSQSLFPFSMKLCISMPRNEHFLSLQLANKHVENGVDLRTRAYNNKINTDRNRLIKEQPSQIINFMTRDCAILHIGFEI